MPTTGSATFSGTANYVLAEANPAAPGTQFRENGVPASVTADFATGKVDVRVVGPRATIDVKGMEIGATIGSISGAGIAVEGLGRFAGPNASETAGVFSLEQNGGPVFAVLEVIAGR